jgi:hypothetical protein
MTRQQALEQGHALILQLRQFMKEHNITSKDIADYRFKVELLQRIGESVDDARSQS